MGRLIFIGLGLTKGDMTLRGLELAKGCDILVAEEYTSHVLEGGTGWLEKELGRHIEMLAREDDLAAMLIGSTLAVALLTAVLAAVITRQLTRPIVRLTMSAVKIAGGDLEQTVELNRRDEIGILARAFNIMTAELRSLYASLEQKVDERTQQLTDVNRELRYKAMQLRLSAEVGRVATSIIDPDLL